MLTGHKLYESENVANLVHAHLHQPVPRLPERLAGYQPVLDRMLAKDPDRRFQSAREVFTLIAI
jgi:serine/threonine-protein kinase PpkA